MAILRKRRSPPLRSGSPPEESKSNKKGKARPPPQNAHSSSSGYEKFREERIKENRERMEKLGILNLSTQLKSRTLPIKCHAQSSKSSTVPSQAVRRSSRLKTLAPVKYAEVHVPKEKPLKNIRIFIAEGSKPEVYTEQHVKLLGDSKTAWTLFVDGFGEDGLRIYDPVDGKSCHQCRQKTLGHRTHCSKCNSGQGQLCGDCLYMRYGENVIEANEDPNWTCPVCRGICNCSRCRREKGWVPTGSLYQKVIQLGYKSVAHYLINTRHALSTSEDSVGAKTSLQSLDEEAQVVHGDCSKPSDESSKLNDCEHEDTKAAGRAVKECGDTRDL